MTKPRFSSYAEFWPFYLSQHSLRRTRLFHLVGLTLAVLFTITCLALNRPAGLPLALVLGYGPAWYAHFFIEHNRPATFGHPVWSFFSDFRMAYLTIIGRL